MREVFGMSDWILVVDDDVLNLKMAKHILSGSNMRVSCLKSGEEAVEFLKKNSPDLLLLDVHMPGMNGFETISVIRENKNIGIADDFLDQCGKHVSDAEDQIHGPGHHYDSNA